MSAGMPEPSAFGSGSESSESRHDRTALPGGQAHVTETLPLAGRAAGPGPGSIELLPRLAAAIIGVEGTSTLLARLEQVLERLGALPARLWLLDSASGGFYPAAGFASAVTAGLEDLAAEAWQGPRRHAVRQAEQVVGLIEVLGEHPYQAGSLDCLGALLGPVLLGAQRQEATIDELRRLHERLGYLVQAGGLLRHLDLEELLVKIMQTLLKAVGAEVGAVLTADDSDSTLRLTVAWGLREDHIAALRRLDDGRTVAAAVHADGEPLRLDAQGIAQTLELPPGIRLTGLLALPLATEQRRHGVVLLANPGAAFDREGEEIASTLCHLATIALDNVVLVRSLVERERLARELDLARQVQADMLPPSGIDEGPFRVRGAFSSCEETGGDYYTFFSEGGRLVAMVGDVTGHGLGAALFTTIAHAMIQQQYRSAAASPGRGLEVLNQGLYHTRSGRFMTAATVEIDLQTYAMRYASAGHNPLLWIHNGVPRWLDSTTMPLGILPDSTCEDVQVGQLTNGDVVLLYSDGITEAANAARELWGEDRLAATVMAASAGGPQAIVDAVLTAVADWLGGGAAEDDLTMVALVVVDASASAGEGA